MARKIDKTDISENEKEVKLTSNSATEKYKTEKCKVLVYNKKTKDLDIDFKGCGIRLNNVDHIKSDVISIKYKGEIGKSNFSCKI